MPSAVERCYTGFLSAYLRCPPPSGTPPAVWEQSGITAVAEQAYHKCAEMGAYIDAFGMAWPEQPSALLDLRSTDRSPLTHRQRGWWECINKARASRMQSCKTHGARITQCAGDEGGIFLNATAAEMGFSLSDAEFRHALRMRLGLNVCEKGYCQHSSSKPGPRSPVCGACLDTKGVHATSCKIGGEVNVMHDNGRDILHAAARAAGFRALTEQVVPELRTSTRKEPRLDVEAWGHPACQRLLVDFTVRDPAVSRYDAIRHKPAAVAEQAEREKHNEYPEQAGVRVRGACMEKLGRHGPGLAQLLEELADLARQRDEQMGQAPRRWLRIWRAQLSAACIRACSRAITRAVEDCRGRETFVPLTARSVASPARSAASVQLGARPFESFGECRVASPAHSSQQTVPGSQPGAPSTATCGDVTRLHRCSDDEQPAAALCTVGDQQAPAHTCAHTDP